MFLWTAVLHLLQGGFFYPMLLLLLIAQQDIIMRMLQSCFIEGYYDFYPLKSWQHQSRVLQITLS